MKSHRTIEATAAAVLIAALAPATSASGTGGTGPGGRPDPRVGSPRPVEIVVRDAGFDWVDAAIGAATSAGLACLIAGGALLTRHSGMPMKRQTRKGIRR